MKVAALHVMVLLLASSIAVPIGFSQAQTDNQTKIPDSNQTSVTTNSSLASGQNIGQQVSDFVHNATAIFKQQRNETIQAIKDCHEKIQNSTADQRATVRDQCNTTLDAIKEKYQDARTMFQQLFKQFRENIITLRHDAEGLSVSAQDIENATKNIDEKAAKNGLAGLSNALEHLKGMGKHGMSGIERAMTNMNEINASNTGSNESSSQSEINSTYGMPQGQQQMQHGPPSTPPGQENSHGKQ